MTLSCETVRDLLPSAARDTLREAEARAVREHLDTCIACRARAMSESALNSALEDKLPRYAAPVAMKRRLAALWSPPAAARRPLASAVLQAMAIAAVVAVLAGTAASVLTSRSDQRARLVEESVNDHLRLLSGPALASVAGGLHEVKPWFGGKLDFAPSLRFAGDSEFPLDGGAVEAFLDRRAAVFVFGRRLHKVSLFVLRPDGLRFPAAPSSQTVRGFNVVLWEANEQAYALVSDLNLDELLDLQRRIAGAGA